jgi:TRAP-type C4-dicarboxylate transport system substrate-binding protein
MPKKFYLLVVTILLSIGLAACGGSETSSQNNKVTDSKETDSKGTDSKETITLKVADYLNTTQIFYTEGTQYWMDRVKELTKGQVEFEHYPSGQLGDSSALLELTKNKTIDIVGFGGSYVSDQMPLADVATLPGAYSTAYEGTKAYWKIANEVLLENTFLSNGVMPVWTATTPPYQIVTKGKKVESPSDFKKLKVRTAGGIQELVAKELGGEPVSVEGPEILQALERGTVDAVFSDITSITPYQLYKPADHTTLNANLTGFVLIYAMNKDVYEDLPDNIKEALKQASEETMDHLAKAEDDLVKGEIESLPEKGVEMNKINDAQLVEWNEILQKVQTEWISKLEKRGLPAQDVADGFLEAVEKVE